MDASDVSDLLDTTHPEPMAIFILGPSSSGKTTLCNALAERLALGPDKFVKEVARTVMKTNGFTRDDCHKYEMQHAIMAAQLKAEATVLSRAGTGGGITLLSDRSAVDPIVYAATSGREDSEAIQRKLRDDAAFNAIVPFYRRSLFVILQPVAEWLEDDGVRSLEDPWKYNIRLREMLATLDIPFEEIAETTKDLSKRVDLVIRYSQRRQAAEVLSRCNDEAPAVPPA